MRQWEGKLTQLNRTIDQFYQDIARKGSDSVGMSWKRSGVVRGRSHIHVIVLACLRECEEYKKCENPQLVR
jgi:hypothetical protein